jgi:hypothetical protein
MHTFALFYHPKNTAFKFVTDQVLHDIHTTSFNKWEHKLESMADDII